MATVPIPIPGLESDRVALPALAPVDKWFQFSAPEPITRWQFPRKALQEPSPDTGGAAVGQLLPARERYTLGDVRVAVVWGGEEKVGQRSPLFGFWLLPERITALSS